MQTVRKCLNPSIIASLEREASERDEPQAQGLVIFIKTYDFVATLLMICDLLPVLSALSKAFQTRDGAFSLVKPSVSGTIASIKSLKTNPGQHYQALEQMLTDLTFPTPSSERTHKFTNEVYMKFCDSVTKNLEKRFPDMPLFESFDAFNQNHWPEDRDELAAHGNHAVKTLAMHFHQHLEKEAAVAEYRLFKKTVAAVLPNLGTLATVGLLLPTSTAGCERGFSTLGRVKSKLRNRLTNKVPYVLKMNYEATVERWSNQQKQRIEV